MNPDRLEEDVVFKAEFAHQARLISFLINWKVAPQFI